MTAGTAPGDLRLIEAFVNTTDLEDGTDRLDSSAGLAAWLAEQGLGEAGAVPSAAGRARTVELREALRDLLGANNGEPLDPATVATVNDIARAAPVRLAVAPDGEARLEPVGDGIDAALARLLAIVARAQADGTWERLKACSADSCRWAFYDHSRNHSRNWCSMRVCGNRSKARAYRQRTARRGGA